MHEMLLPYAKSYLSNGKDINVSEGVLYGFGKYFPEDEYV